MPQPDVQLPTGHRLACFDTIDSTNAEALRRAELGEHGPLWICAAEQCAGRGRMGRGWASPAGNLHASLLLRTACPVDTALQLVFVAGLAVHDAVSDLCREPLQLKWPNDLLLSGRKLAGVLIESVGGSERPGATIVVGTGLNLVAHPEEALRPATDLAAHSIDLAVPEALQRLATATATRLETWAEGAGFAQIRESWEERALPVGEAIRVRINDHERLGTYAGIDAMGALRMIETGGNETRITTGDVFLQASGH
ncbi:MAG: biotin--[acetyl-CoA-carboxylase] ligase [Hyphomicrobiales bacterium]|nr:biotin--[acetyl-CoA-carboxylase] ligase [Hyphomicrobiales bacterium]